jgi:hypothetical protein
MTNRSLFFTTSRCTSSHRRTARSSLPVDETGAPLAGHASLQYRGSDLRPGRVYTTPIPRSPASDATMTESSISAALVHRRLDAITPSGRLAHCRSRDCHHLTSVASRFSMSLGCRRSMSRSQSEAM